MRKTVRQRIIDLLNIGFFPTKKTNPTDLFQLIGRLRPITTDFELIRLGPQGDGGYLVPNDLEGIEACFSPGISDSSDFELACANLGMHVFMADYSVDGPATSHKNFNFTKKFVGATTSDNFMTLSDWVKQSPVGSNSDLLLQMDIEGYEYETLLSIPDDLMKRFRIIIVEFHRLHHLWSKPFYRLASSTFAKLLQTHSCVHLHPNNCRSSFYMQDIEIPRVMEFTFLRNDRFNEHTYTDKFPHPLDMDNTKNPSVKLPECWYGLSPNMPHSNQGQK